MLAGALGNGSYLASPEKHSLLLKEQKEVKGEEKGREEEERNGLVWREE